MAIAGVLFGASMYLPFLFNAHWLNVSIVNHSIVYESTLIYDDYLPRVAVTAVYMLFVIVPLLLSSNLYHRNLGSLMLLSTIVTVLFFDFAFISVWCYFAAAIISVYLLHHRHFDETCNCPELIINKRIVSSFNRKADHAR